MPERVRTKGMASVRVTVLAPGPSGCDFLPRMWAPFTLARTIIIGTRPACRRRRSTASPFHHVGLSKSPPIRNIFCRDSENSPLRLQLSRCVSGSPQPERDAPGCSFSFVSRTATADFTKPQLTKLVAHALSPKVKGAKKEKCKGRRQRRKRIPEVGGGRGRRGKEV